jgi:hypothetical protein
MGAQVQCDEKAAGIEKIIAVSYPDEQIFLF